MSSSGQDNASGEGSEGAGKPFWGREAVMDVYPNIQAYVFSRIEEPHASDIVQDTILAIIKGMDRVKARQRKQFLKWCYTIARNKINDLFRQKRGGNYQEVSFEVLKTLIMEHVDERGVPKMFLQDLEFFLSRLQKLKFPCDKLLRLHFLAGMDDEELAAEYGVNKHTMRMRLKRCMEAAIKIAKRFS